MMSLEFFNELYKIVQENPNIPIIPLVNAEVVAEDYPTWWEGYWHEVSIEYFLDGTEVTWFKSIADEYDVVADICGEDVADNITEEEMHDLFENQPWKKYIVVWISV